MFFAIGRFSASENTSARRNTSRTRKPLFRSYAED
jgi:hypothetical protein